MKYLVLLFTLMIHGFFCNGVYAQSYFKGPALVEGIEETVTSAGTKILDVTSQTRQIFTGTQNHTLRMANATTLPVGRYIYVANRSTGVITIQNNSLVTIGTVAPGDQKYVILKNNSTINGTWDLSENQTVNALLLQLQRATSTGVLDGLNLSINGGNPARLDIAAGLYDIADLTDVNAPVITQVNFPGITNVAITNLATQDTTYILLGLGGTIIQQATFPTPSQRRQYAFVGRVNHSNRTTISFVDTFPDFKISPVASFYDLVDALAPFKMDDGSQISANGANLSFDRSAGKVFFRADNYASDKTNPHTKTYTGQTLQPFRRMTRTVTVDAADVTVLDPANYDNGGMVTAIGGATGRSTIQRIYLYKSGSVRVAYGQIVYNTFADATAAVGKEAFIGNPTLEQTAVLMALVVLRRNCTSLLDTSCALIVPASRFGGVGGGGGGGGTTDLQNSDLTLTAADTLAIDTLTLRQTWLVQGATAAVSMSTTPFGTTDAADGSEVTIVGNSDSFPVTFVASNIANGILGYDVTLFKGMTVTYKYKQTLDRWVIKAFSN